MSKSICTRRGIAAILASMMAFTSVPMPAMAQTAQSSALGEIKLDPQHHYQTLEGWGTSLCWWGNIIGADAANDYNGNGTPDREEIAELAFSPEYLNLNIVRYNVGGGDKADSSIKRVEGRVPGWSQDMFNSDDGSGDFLGEAFYDKQTEDMNDAGQIWMLEQANKWRKDNGKNDIINEVFANSPPYYMTKSESSTGGHDGSAWDKENLKDDYYDDFGLYMARATKWLDQNLTSKGYKGIDYIEPINEPDTNYWLNGSTKQEGCIFYPGESQNKVYRETKNALIAEGLTDDAMTGVKLTGTDETSLDKAIWSFDHLDDQTRKDLDVISAHTYGGNDSERVRLRNMAASYDKGLWMSEVTKGGGSHGKDSHSSMSETQTEWQSKGIMSDLKKMQSTAWIAWLVADSEYECIQTNSNWGLLHYVFEKDGPVKDYHWNLVDGEGNKKEDVPSYGYWAVTKQFYTMMQYSKYLKAGYTMIEIGDDNMCAAVSPDRKELVIVAQNFGGERSTSVDLHKLSNASNVKLYRTSDSESCEEVEAAALSGNTLRVSLPGNSVSTYVITAEDDNTLYDIEGYKKVVDCDVQTSDQTFAAGASDNNKFTYNGDWATSDWVQEMYTTNRDATAAFKFTGTQAAIYGKKSSNGAELTVQVDSGEPVIVSAAAASEARRTLLYKTPELPDGEHTVTIGMTAEQTAAQPEIVIEYAEIIHGRLTDAEVTPLSDYMTVRGMVPNLPHTVAVKTDGGQEEHKPVEWNVTSDTFDVADYTTVTITGTIKDVVEQASAKVVVVPGNLQYFVDCNNAGSSMYRFLDGLLDLKNEVPDQSIDNGAWGYMDTYGNYDGSDRFDSGWFAGNDQSISYKIPMKAGSYALSFGFKEWWAQYEQNRPMKITASYTHDGGTVEKVLGSAHITNNDPVKVTDTVLDLPADADVTFTVSKTGNQDPVLSFFSIRQTVNHTQLIAALGQARTLDRSKYGSDALKELDATVNAGYQHFTAAETTNEASDNAAKAIADALAALGTGSEFTEEQLIANDYILYLANCGTPDASVVPHDYKLGLMQSKVDQAYGKDSVSGNLWGYALPDDYSRIVPDGNDASDIAASFVYMDSNTTFDKDRSGLKYAFTVPADDYEVTLGFKNPWSERQVNVKLEGETAHTDLDLKTEELVEKQYITHVSDGELNVMVHSPNRQDQYGDPMLSYIIVRAVPDYTLDMLGDALTGMSAAVDGNTWYEDALEAFEEARTAAEALIAGGSQDGTAIKEAYMALSNAFAQLEERVPYNSITGVDGWTQYDTNGKQIQAHGGQIQQFTEGGKYYWIGEDKTYDYRPVGGIHVYSSDDLYNWKDEGVVLKTMESMDEFEDDPYFRDLYSDYDDAKKTETFIDLDKNNCVIERPKMLYNEKTDKYVIWFHADGRFPGNPADYGKAKAGIAISDSPAGPFKLLGSYKLNYHDDPDADHGYDGWDGRGSLRDMNLFKDDDGSAYIIYSSEGNETTFISRLNDEYTDLAVPREEAVEGEHFTRNFVGWSREAPAMFKYNDKYYMVNSGCTGWSPNPAQYAVADHPMGPWTAMGDPCEGTDSHTTFYTQSTCVFPVDAENGKFIYMGDRWNAGDLSESRYVWLPVEFLDGDRISLKRYSNWTLKELDNKGLARITSELPDQFESLAEMKAALPAAVDVSIGAEEYQDVEVTWDHIDETRPYAGKYRVKGTLKQDNRSVSYEADIVDSKMMYFFDSAAETSDYLDLLKESAKGLKNTLPDQAYTKELRAGYLGTEEVDFGIHNGQDLYSSGWWAEENKVIEYRFDLTPGEYKAVTGYQEWWNTTRDMKVLAVMQKADGTETELAKQNFTLQNDDYNLVQELSFTVPSTDAGGKSSIIVRVEKSGSSDVVLSFIGISADKVEEETFSISGEVTAENAAVEEILVNLYQGDINADSDLKASPSNAVKTDAAGAYSFPKLEDGTYSVEIPEQNGYKSNVLVLDVKGTDITNADFALVKEGTPEPEEKSEISGTVTIEDEPAPDVTVNLYQGEIDSDLQSKASPSDAVKTDAAGAYSFRDLKNGTYSVEIPAGNGYKRNVLILELNGSDIVNADFALESEDVPEDELSIRIETLPDKRNYLIGEELDLEGLEVALYRNGEADRVLEEDEFTVSEFDSSTAGSRKITITYTEVEKAYKAYFKVSVYDEEQTPSIKVVKKPIRLFYLTGEDLDTTGMEVRGLNLGDEPISVLDSDDYVAEYDFSKAGNVLVTVIYQMEEGEEEGAKLTDTFEVKVFDAEEEPEFFVEKIEIIKKPHKLVYAIDDSFEPEGMVVEKTVKVIASPSNASYKEEISLDELEIEEDLSRTGSKKIKVSYETEGQDGETKVLYDTVTITVTKSESALLEGNLDAAVVKMEEALTLGKYLTKEEKRAALRDAVDSAKDCFASYESNSSKAMDILKLMEKAVLEHSENITTTVQADSFFGEFKVAGLALSADFSNQSAQQIKMKVAKSSEKVPEHLAENIKSYVAMDLTMFNQGSEIQPELPLQIQMDIPAGLSKENLVIYHNHDGEWKMIRPVISGGKMIFTVSELSVFAAANLKEDQPEPPKPTDPSHDNDSRDESTGPAFTVQGSWQKDATGWWYKKTAGGYVTSMWAQINGIWYYFDDRGYMKTGWLQDAKGLWYYLQEDGSMAAGKWVNWKEKWYYMTWNGAMAVSTATPDGYIVGADGAWIIPANAIKN